MISQLCAPAVPSLPHQDGLLLWNPMSKHTLSSVSCCGSLFVCSNSNRSLNYIVTKPLTKATSKRAGFVLALVLRLQFIMAWKATLAATEESEEAALQSGSREMSDTVQLTFSFFSFLSARTPAHQRMLPTVRQGLPSSGDPLWKHKYSQRCVS